MQIRVLLLQSDAKLIEELLRLSRGEGFDEQPPPGLCSEAIDFRAASESFAALRDLRSCDLESLRLVGVHPPLPGNEPDQLCTPSRPKHTTKLRFL
jgi:hypothetical protein